mmetsp:Transcript_66854/g.161662  ORF Transcript_66854/g.161662 Transcript_66854/m.161662 type:complete len:221 (-) Transcript_66854:2-664(-)
MGVLAAGQREAGLQVGLEVGDGANSLDEGGVNGLLEVLALLRHNLLGVVALGEELLGVAGGLGLDLLEEGVGHLGGVDGSDIDLGGGGDDVGLVHTAKGDTVDLEGARDEQETRLELTQEDDALTLEATGKEDEHSARGDGATELGLLVLVLAGGDGASDIIGGVEAGLLGGGGLGHNSVLGNCDLLVAPGTTLALDGSAGEGVDALGELTVAGGTDHCN